MDGSLVSGSSSNSEGGGGNKGPAPRFAYTDAFNRVFPYYLSIGMTYELFWEKDATLVEHYRKAAKIRQDLSNQNAWLQGAYIYEALIDASPVLRAFAKKGTKPTPYRDAPYELFDKSDKKQKVTVQEKSDMKAKQYMEMFAAATNQKFKKKGGGVNG